MSIDIQCLASWNVNTAYTSKLAIILLLKVMWLVETFMSKIMVY